MKGSRFLRVLTVVNILFFAVNILGGWFLFFTYGARPDGVEPTSRHFLAALWILGPLWSVGCFVVALIIRKRGWETWVNAAICIVYALLWGLVGIM